MRQSGDEYIQAPPIPARHHQLLRTHKAGQTLGLYYRFNLSHRDIADMLAERVITVTRESIRLSCIKFGAIYIHRLRGRHKGYGDTFYIDEVLVKIRGKEHYLWRAVDQDGEVVDVYLQTKRDGAAAKRFFRRLLRSHGGEPRQIVTDKLRSYGVAHRELIPETIHVNDRYANNRAEQSHEATRVRERGMRMFKSLRQTQRFLGVHAAVSNRFNLGRHMITAEHYRSLRVSAFEERSRAVA
ncbi:IS6 family transposase [Congregibacter variabilis]|uniref:IS6 family transposase n=1 Tax=Congregibacter variabilis TaxID=3081200 RepID=A0ABZ0I6J1_9GAMM|nr:IS6 family transposase [Congregibacter sp. IMCC43200]